MCPPAPEPVPGSPVTGVPDGVGVTTGTVGVAGAVGVAGEVGVGVAGAVGVGVAGYSARKNSSPQSLTAGALLTSPE